MELVTTKPLEARRAGRPIRDVLDYWRDPIGSFVRALQHSPAPVPYQFGPFKALMVQRSEHIEQVLVKKHTNYVKGRNYEPLKLTLGNGLVTSEGDFWKSQRKLMQPAFHRRSLESFVRVMANTTEEEIARLKKGGSRVLDIHDEMVRLTFRIVGLTLFSADVDASADSIGQALETMLEITNRRTEALVRWPAWVPTPDHVRLRRARQVFDDLIFEIVNDRRRQAELHGESELPHDLLWMLLKSGMPDNQLRDECITLAAAGHETTANALSWTWYLLSKHPEVARRVREEVEAVLGGETPTLADVGRLTYTEKVIKESMRLYPPVWGFERAAVEADEIGGVEVPKGSLVMILPYTIHRDPNYWHNPEGFDPDRFDAEADAKRPRFAYLPFGGGPRVCIGNAFAMMEAKIIVALMMRSLKLDLVPGHPIELEPSVTLRPKHGVRVQLSPR